MTLCFTKRTWVLLLFLSIGNDAFVFPRFKAQKSTQVFMDVYEFLATNPTDEEKEEFLENLARENSISMENPIKDPMERLKSWAGTYNKTHARSILDRVIAENDIVIFGRTGCTYTLEAKDMLQNQSIAFASRDFDTLANYKEGYALHAELAEMTNRTSVPVVFLAGEYIGGCHDGPGLKTLLDNGTVQKRLNL